MELPLGGTPLIVRKLVDEGMVLVATGTDAADDTFTFGRGHTVVFTITATCSQLLYILGFCPTPLLI